MSDQLPNAALDDRLDAVIAEYLESIERGETSDPKRWLAQHPDLARELEAFFTAEAKFGRLVAPLRNVTSVETPTPGRTPPARPSDPPALRTIADYDILSELGRGGMGVIWKARQRSLNRLVAIKMIRSAEWATPGERLRFRWEAETVAALDHPNIVPIYEIGEFASDDGTQLPFFSMKLIEGESLAEGRGRFKNDWNGIARLMSLVTRAVEHAHRRGVLHRDLKPANVLLRIVGDGTTPPEQRELGLLLGTTFITPHISDFGLARQTHLQRAGTLPGTIVGTPSYLAPEMARGHERATSASDVYSLGAILYELLTGAPPFQAATALETIRLAASQPVKLPRKGNPAIPRDLETICLKCLESEPERRYPSADKFADDLELFLAHRPIAARPIGTLERFGRWCRRQPVIAGLSAALLTAVVAGVPLIVWNWRRAVEQEHLAEDRLVEAQHERDNADNAFGLAHSAVEDIFKLLAEDRWEEMPGSEAFKKRLLENSLKYYRSFVERKRDDVKLRREVARAMFQMGMIATRIGTKSEAAESFQTAITLLRTLLTEEPDDVQLKELLAKSLTNLGNALSSLNRQAEGVAAQDEAAELWAQLRRTRTDGSEAVRAQASAWLNRGVAIQGQEDWPKALESFRRTRSLLTEGGPNATDARLMTMCLLNICQAEDRLGHDAEALAAAREAKAYAERILEAAPQSEDARLMMAYANRSVGVQSRKQGDLEAAKGSLLAARKGLTELHQLRPRSTEISWNLSLTCEELSDVAERQKRPLESLEALVLAETLMLELVELDPGSHPNRASLARIERRLGRLHEDLGNPDATRKAFEQAKVQLEFLLSHGSAVSTLRPDLAGVCHQLAVALSRLQKHRESAGASAEAARHYRILLDRAPTDARVRKNLSSVLGNLAITHRALRQLPEALTATRERVRLWPNNAAELYDAATDFARTFDLASRATESAPKVAREAGAEVIETLRLAMRAGFKDTKKIPNEPLFKMIRETPEFREYLKTVEVDASP